MAYDFSQGDELNQDLQSLIEQVKEHSPRSLGRRRALERLIRAIINSGQLSKQTRWRDLPNFDDFYNEALDQALLEICQKLDQYKHDKPVMAWVNFYFNNRLNDLVNKSRKQGIKNVPKKQAGQKKMIKSLDDLDQELAQEEERKEMQETRDFIQEDPAGKLQQKYIKGYPHATLKKILWLKFVEDKKWKDISVELNIPISTLASFTQKCLKEHNLKAYFKQYL